MSDIAVFSFGRTSSQRCPNKMTRPFAGTTLTDIALEKLKQLKAPVFFAGYEDIFKEKCAKHGVPFVKRSERSANIDSPIVEILSFLRDVKASHFLLVSACLPLLSAKTIAGFLEQCAQEDRKPAFGVRLRHNYFLTRSRKALNFDPSVPTINTKTVEPVYEFAHAMYFFEKDYFFANGAYWDWRTVRLIELRDAHELVDVDTEEDFAFAESAWSARNRNG